MRELPKLITGISSNILSVETRHGPLFIYDNDKPIADGLKLYGEWAGIETEFLQQFIPDNGAIIDAGCHVGLHSAAFADGRPKLTIHAFEPQPELQELATLNMEAVHRRSGATLVLHPVALGNTQGQAYMPRLDFSRPTNAGANQLAHAPMRNGITVQVTTLDALELPPVSFIKLDLEGYEGAALEGAHKLLDRDRPVLFCEINCADGAARILQATRGFNYQAYLIETAAFNPLNYRDEPKDVFGHARESGLLLLPPSAPPPARKRAAALERVSDLDTLVRLLHATPRYGDATSFDRNPARLRAELQRLTGRLDTATSESTSRRPGQEEPATALQEERQLRLHMTAQLVATLPLTVRNHWVCYISWMLGRSPLAKACRRIVLSGLFDRRWYRRRYPVVATSGIHPLVHYLLYGAYEGRNPNPVFDSSFYLSRNPEVRAIEMNPLLHYVKHGEAEGRQPSADFLPAEYLVRHPWLKERRQAWRRSPLRHFLRHGRPGEAVLPAYRPASPAWSEFERLAPRALPTNGDVVDVIVPVYRGHADTFSCLLSVLSSHNRTPFELIVIDDCSPEPQISADLSRLAARGLITLLRNEKNLGFVATVNRGMSLHLERDVLLLNSDTLVFNDWLDRIRAHALVPAPRIATVTPFTNSGTICTYPRMCNDTRAPLEIGYAELDQLAAASNSGQSVEVPSGVGFCMYITRAALAEVGLFSVEHFGTGYGEENDFCMRAASAGWRNVHALDTFVFHSGETSFVERAAESKKRAHKVLLRLHPDYKRRVQCHVLADPARHARIALDIARAFGRPVRPLTLCITHTLGGGINRHLDERRALLDAEEKDLLVATPAAPGSLTACFRAAGSSEPPQPSSLGELHLVDAMDPLCWALRQHDVQAIEVHSTVGWSVDLLQAVRQMAAQLSVDYTVMLHDYVTICPRVTLINESGRYCGEVGPEQCRICLQKNTRRARRIHPDWRPAGVEEWRRRYADFLASAARVTVPSQDAARRLQRYFPGLALEVRPHLDLPSPTHQVNPAPLREGSPLRVVLIGAIGPHKGSRVLHDCARDALARRLPLHFIVVGYTDLPALARVGNVTVTGPYREEEVYRLLAEQQPHMIFLPSVCPETFSYTLSIAMATGLPTAVFDLGAQAERLEGYPRALRLPLALIETPALLNDRLLAYARPFYNGESLPQQVTEALHK